MKNLVLALAFIVISSTVFSQIKIRPGVRSGINIANLTNSNSDALTDLYLGGFAAVEFVHFYELQPEINYSRQGAKSRFSGVDNIEVQYLGFTLTNKFSPFREIGLNFILGPTINFRVGDNTSVFSNGIEDFDFLFFGGFGYDFPFGLGVEARYNIGLIDVFGNSFDFDDDDNNDDFYDDDFFDEVALNTVFQIGLTYKFDF